MVSVADRHSVGYSVGMELKRLIAAAGYDGYADLAETVAERWAMRSPTASIPKWRSLVPKLSHLSSGKRGWWERREDAVAALADALHVTPSTLGFGGELAVVPEVILVDEVPGMSVDLREQLPQLGKFGKLHYGSDVFSLHAGPDLVVAELPIGWGGGLALAGARCADASVLDPGPVRLTFDHVFDALSVADLEARVRETGLSETVLGRVREAGEGAEVAYKRLAARGYVVLLTSDVTGVPMGLPVYDWEPHPAWKILLLDWLCDRFTVENDDSSTSSSEILQRLAEIDPYDALAESPEELLWFAGRLVSGDVGKDASLDTLADDFVGWAAGRATGVEPARLVEVFRKLVVRTFDDLSVSRLDGSPISFWKDYIAGLGIPHDEPPHSLALALQEARLLRAFDGGLTLGPDWVVEALDSRSVRAQVHARPNEVWPRYARSTSRREALIQSLGTPSFDWDALLRLIERCSLDGADGALDAVLFQAVGLQLALRPDSIVQEEHRVVLRHLLEAVLPSVRVWAPGNAPRPVWVADPVDGAADVEWVLACWAWSLRSTVDALNRGALDDWLFPGWGAPLLDEVPGWLASLPSMDSSHTWLVHALLRLADDLWTRVQTSERTRTGLPDVLAWAQAVHALRSGDRSFELPRVLSNGTAREFILEFACDWTREEQERLSSALLGEPTIWRTDPRAADFVRRYARAETWNDAWEHSHSREDLAKVFWDELPLAAQRAALDVADDSGEVWRDRYGHDADQLVRIHLDDQNWRQGWRFWCSAEQALSWIADPSVPPQARAALVRRVPLEREELTALVETLERLERRGELPPELREAAAYLVASSETLSPRFAWVAGVR